MGVTPLVCACPADLGRGEWESRRLYDLHDTNDSFAGKRAHTGPSGDVRALRGSQQGDSAGCLATSPAHIETRIPREEGVRNTPGDSASS